MASRDSVPVEELERARMTAAEASWALRDVARAVADLDLVLSHRLGLRPLDYAALDHVLRAPGAVSPHQLSGLLGMSTGSTSELLDRLERAGHVRRDRSDADRRRVMLSPTPQAVRRVLDEVGMVVAELDEVAGRFSDEEQRVVVDYLRAVARALREHAAGGD